jgi:hypothetical protein
VITVAGFTIARTFAHRDHVRQDDPERSVDGPEPMPGSVSHQGGQLLAECQVLGDEARPRPESREERTDDGLDQRQHHPTIAAAGPLVIGESESRIGYAGPTPYFPSTLQNAARTEYLVTTGRARAVRRASGPQLSPRVA